MIVINQAVDSVVPRFALVVCSFASAEGGFVNIPLDLWEQRLKSTQPYFPIRPSDAAAGPLKNLKVPVTYVQLKYSIRIQRQPLQSPSGMLPRIIRMASST